MKFSIQTDYEYTHKLRRKSQKLLGVKFWGYARRVNLTKKKKTPIHVGVTIRFSKKPYIL